MIPEPIQDPWELDRLVSLYRDRLPKRVLEIGTNNGGTLYHWAKHATPGATVVSVDLGDRDQYKEYAPQFQSWIPPLAKLHAIEGDSTAFDTIREMAKYGPYDFIFIDGDHSYEGVKADWNTALRLASAGPPRCVIALHDIICERTPEDDLIYGPCEVRHLWAMIKHQGYNVVEYIAGMNGSYPSRENPEDLGIGVVFLD